MPDRPLPLFPLATVLYPGGVAPLHIFEPRYRRMLGYCLEFDRRFGFIFHDPDVSGPFLNEPGQVGCVAEIGRVELLEDGRSLILTEGKERFRIKEEAETEAPYFEAWVEAVPDDPVAGEELATRRGESLDLFHRVLRHAGELPGPLPDFSTVAELSYPLAATVDTVPQWHQQLLELTDERERLDRVDEIFRAAERKIEAEEYND